MGTDKNKHVTLEDVMAIRTELFEEYKRCADNYFKKCANLQVIDMIAKNEFLATTSRFNAKMVEAMVSSDYAHYNSILDNAPKKSEATVPNA